MHPPHLFWIKPFRIARKNHGESHDIIRQCYVDLTDAAKKYQDKWICDDWFRVIGAYFPDIINSISFKLTAFTSQTLVWIVLNWK
jgi:hypothetical protein